MLCIVTLALYAQNTPSSASVVSNIQVALDDKDSLKIVISWKLPNPSQIESLRLYRSNSQIYTSSLAALTPRAFLNANTTQYTDTIPNAESEYYYALVSELKDKTIFEVIIPSVNATVNSVTPLPLQTKLASLIQPNPVEKGRNERELIPLPFLNIVTHSEELKSTITSEAQNTAKELGSSINYYSSKSIYIFPEDSKPLSGEQYLLSTIINTSFMQNDWIQAEQDLRKFLNINRSAQVTKRATFYIAQTLYYQARYPEALRLFINTEDVFPDLTREWIDSVLRLYTIPAN